MKKLVVNTSLSPLVLPKLTSLQENVFIDYFEFNLRSLKNIDKISFLYDILYYVLNTKYQFVLKEELIIKINIFVDNWIKNSLQKMKLLSNFYDELNELKINWSDSYTEQKNIPKSIMHCYLVILDILAAYGYKPHETNKPLHINEKINFDIIYFLESIFQLDIKFFDFILNLFSLYFINKKQFNIKEHNNTYHESILKQIINTEYNELNDVDKNQAIDIINEYYDIEIDKFDFVIYKTIQREFI